MSLGSKVTFWLLMIRLNALWLWIFLIGLAKMLFFTYFLPSRRVEIESSPYFLRIDHNIRNLTEDAQAIFQRVWEFDAVLYAHPNRVTLEEVHEIVRLEARARQMLRLKKKLLWERKKLLVSHCYKAP